MAIRFLPNQIQNAITACWECRTHCQKMLYLYCLEKGGNHVNPAHVKLMTDCMEITQTAADFMVRGSELYEPICIACAEVCYACADACEAISDGEMQECAQLCRKCAEICDDLGMAAMAEVGRDSVETNISLI